MSFTHSIPTELLISTEDIQVFLKWRRSHAADDYGPGDAFILSAREYWAFTKHLDKEKPISKPHASTESRSATLLCEHKLHAVDTSLTDNDRCPICEIQEYVIFLNAIAKVYQDAGGPWPPPRHVTKRWVQLRGAWNKIRHRLTLIEDSLVNAIEAEDRCNDSLLGSAKKQHAASTLEQALQLIVMDVKYPAFISIEPPLRTKRQGTNLQNSNKHKNPKAQKTVTFATDTTFTPSRPNTAYHRPSATYTPGKHACPSHDDFINTSGCGTIQADMLNLKLYVTHQEKAFYSTEHDAPLRPGQYQGLIGAHPGAGAIDEFLMRYQEAKTDGAMELMEMVRGADALVVLVDGDVVKDARFSFLPDVMKGDWTEAKNVGQSGWTCLRECLGDASGEQTKVMAPR